MKKLFVAILALMIIPTLSFGSNTIRFGANTLPGFGGVSLNNGQTVTNVSLRDNGNNISSDFCLDTANDLVPDGSGGSGTKISGGCVGYYGSGSALLSVGKSPYTLTYTANGQNFTKTIVVVSGRSDVKSHYLFTNSPDSSTSFQLNTVLSGTSLPFGGIVSIRDGSGTTGTTPGLNPIDSSAYTIVLPSQSVGWTTGDPTNPRQRVSVRCENGYFSNYPDGTPVQGGACSVGPLLISTSGFGDHSIPLDFYNINFTASGTSAVDPLLKQTPTINGAKGWGIGVYQSNFAYDTATITPNQLRSHSMNGIQLVAATIDHNRCSWVWVCISDYPLSAGAIAANAVSQYTWNVDYNQVGDFYDLYNYNYQIKYNFNYSPLPITANPFDGDGVTVNGVSYTFRTTPTLANDVKIASSGEDSMFNLICSINGGTINGGAGLSIFNAFGGTNTFNGTFSGNTLTVSNFANTGSPLQIGSVVYTTSVTITSIVGGSGGVGIYAISNPNTINGSGVMSTTSSFSGSTSFTGIISGNTLTVNTFPNTNTPLQVGTVVYVNIVITGYGNGTGGNGTYTVNINPNIVSTSLSSSIVQTFTNCVSGINYNSGVQAAGIGITASFDGTNTPVAENPKLDLQNLSGAPINVGTFGSLNAGVWSSVSFTGSISGSTLTVTAYPSSPTLGPLQIGSVITISGYLNETITGFQSGSGGLGTYTVSPSTQTIPSKTMNLISLSNGLYNDLLTFQGAHVDTFQIINATVNYNSGSPSTPYFGCSGIPCFPFSPGFGEVAYNVMARSNGKQNKSGPQFFFWHTTSPYTASIKYPYVHNNVGFGPLGNSIVILQTDYPDIERNTMVQDPGATSWVPGQLTPNEIEWNYVNPPVYSQSNVAGIMGYGNIKLGTDCEGNSGYWGNDISNTYNVLNWQYQGGTQTYLCINGGPSVAGTTYPAIQNYPPNTTGSSSTSDGSSTYLPVVKPSASTEYLVSLGTSVKQSPSLLTSSYQRIFANFPTGTITTDTNRIAVLQLLTPKAKVQVKDGGAAIYDSVTGLYSYVGALFPACPGKTIGAWNDGTEFIASASQCIPAY